MKKITILIILLTVLLSGCSNEAQVYQEQVKLYTSLWNKVLNKDKFIEIPEGTEIFKAENYSLKGVLTPNEKGTNDYGIIISNPYNALYDVEMIVLPSLDDVNENIMLPNIGIFEDKQYNMIPYQVNNDKGYVSGLSALSDTSEEEMVLYVLVIWYDETLLNMHEDYYKYPVTLKK